MVAPLIIAGVVVGFKVIDEILSKRKKKRQKSNG